MAERKDKILINHHGFRTDFRNNKIHKMCKGTNYYAYHNGRMIFQSNSKETIRNEPEIIKLKERGELVMIGIVDEKNSGLLMLNLDCTDLIPSHKN
jgi:hypothetical protein